MLVCVLNLKVSKIKLSSRFHAVHNVEPITLKLFVVVYLFGLRTFYTISKEYFIMW